MDTPYGAIPDRLARSGSPSAVTRPLRCTCPGPKAPASMQIRALMPAQTLTAVTSIASPFPLDTVTPGTGPAEATGDGTDRELAGRRVAYLRAGPLPTRSVTLAPVPRSRGREVARSFNIRQLTDVLGCNLQHHF